MKDLYIVIQDGTVELRDAEDDNNILFRINRNDLPLKMKDETSEWINQLTDKTWIDTGNLYRLARTIMAEFPDNSIDWRKTFFIVEKENYLREFGEILLTKRKSKTAEFFEMIEFARNEANAETHKIVNDIVAIRLTEFGLF